MLINRTQKQMLRLLRQFGGMKEPILFSLCNEPKRFAGLIHELECFGKIRRVGEYLCDESDRICSRETETALEVMITLEAQHGEYFKGAFPVTVLFFREKDGRLLRYDICVVPQGREMSISAALETVPFKSRVAVFVLEDLRQREYMTVPREHLFAVKQNKNYHFYKGGKKNEI